MIKEKIWTVPLHRAAAFFREQEDVTEERTNVFLFRSSRITIAEVKAAGMGMWATKRIKVTMEGEDADVEAMYHRFFVRFLSM